jgi:hypothetical protein
MDGKAKMFIEEFPLTQMNRKSHDSGMITKFPNTILSGKILTVVFSFLIPS